MHQISAHNDVCRRLRSNGDKCPSMIVKALNRARDRGLVDRDTGASITKVTVQNTIGSI